MIMTAVFVLGVFLLLIIPHELGHFWAAKKCGMRVHRFSLGLGPKLWGFKKGETEYSISVFPLGGYVKIAGMEPGERDLENGFYRKPLRDRILVLSAGSAMNYLVAIILFSLVFMMGFQTLNLKEAVVGEVKKDSAAALASLLPGDKILKINGQEVKGWEEMALAIKDSQEIVLKLEVQREKKVFFIQVKPIFDPQLKRRMIGISPPQVFVRYSPLIALAKGVERTFFITKLILTALGGMIMGKIPAQFAGPVGIVGIIGQSVKMGLSPLFSLAALLSINLGLFNLFPIPALDGGRLLFLAVEGIRGKALDSKKEELIHYIGFVILIALILLITYQDILRWIGAR
ncbi:Regulator of sigma-W protease RasP [subsurface metagenome]